MFGWTAYVKVANLLVRHYHPLDTTWAVEHVLELNTEPDLLSPAGSQTGPAVALMPSELVMGKVGKIPATTTIRLRRFRNQLRKVGPYGVVRSHY